MEEYNKGKENTIQQILKAARDINNNPEKAENYIRKKIELLMEASAQFENDSIIEELFG